MRVPDRTTRSPGSAPASRAAETAVSDGVDSAAIGDDEHLAAAEAVAVLRAALDSIVLADEAGRVLEWNAAAERTFGYSRGDALGRDLADLIIPPDLRDAHHAGLHRYLATGDGPILNHRIEIRGIRASGEEFPVELTVVPVAGKPLRFAAYLRDISERREAEALRRDQVIRQRRFVREILASVTEGRLRLCESASADLPAPLPILVEEIGLTAATLRVLRRAVTLLAQERQFPPERERDLLIAAGEAAMNAVKHGGGGVGRICVGNADSAIQVWIEDHGKGIRDEDLHRATLEKGWSNAGTLGHGFFLMLRTADRIYLLTGPTGTTVVVEQEREPPAPPWFASAPD